MKRFLLAGLLLLPACQQAAPVKEEAKATATKSATQDARRIIKLEGGRNFRDLGGYTTSDGQAVKWRTIYRSGSPEGLTQVDYKTLNDLGIRSVCDFRSTEERKAEPNRWAENAAKQGNLDYWTRDYALDMGEMADALKKDPSPAKTREAIITFYRRMPEDQAASFTAMFRLLADGKIPLAFNCSAGKDRTGMAAGLLLSLLGVPRQTVLDDYALSDKIVNYRAVLEEEAKTNPSTAKLAQLPWHVIQPMFASDPAYLDAAFAAIEKQYGSVDAYIEKRLGVTPAMRDKIRAELREPTKKA